MNIVLPLNEAEKIDLYCKEKNISKMGFLEMPQRKKWNVKSKHVLFFIINYT